MKADKEFHPSPNKELGMTMAGTFNQSLLTNIPLKERGGHQYIFYLKDNIVYQYYFDCSVSQYKPSARYQFKQRDGFRDIYEALSMFAGGQLTINHGRGRIQMVEFGSGLPIISVLDGPFMKMDSNSTACQKRISNLEKDFPTKSEKAVRVLKSSEVRNFLGHDPTGYMLS